MLGEIELKPRKQPTQARAVATVDAILTAAMHILGEGAADQVSTHRIADKAGVSVGSLYQYFPSKEALFSAIIRHHLAKRLESLREALKRALCLPTEKAARSMVDAMIDEKLVHIKLERVMMRYFCRVGDLTSLTQMDDAMIALVHDYLDAKRTVVRPKNRELAAFMIFQSLRGAILVGLLQRPEQLHTEEFRAELTRLVLGYLANSHESSRDLEV